MTISDFIPDEIEDQLALEQRMYEESLKVLDEGQVLTGVIVAKYQDELLVDIGGKSEGVLNVRELSLAVSAEDLKVGDLIEVMVHRIDEEEDTLFLSERRARSQKTWGKVVAAHASGEAVEATVVQVVRGGILVDLGTRGFVPASHIDSVPADLQELVGKVLRLKVLEVDHKRQRIVLSERAQRQDERKEKRAKVLASLGVGQIREGVVARLAAFGAFVDIGGIDGLLHNSELSYGIVSDPSEVVKIGDALQVEVIRFDAEAERVSLSLKSTLPDPWVEHAEKLVEGQRMVARIVKVAANYLLVEIIPGVLAMAPKGEYDPFLQYSPGDQVAVAVLTVNEVTRRITVSVEPALNQKDVA